MEIGRRVVIMGAVVTAVACSAVEPTQPSGSSGSPTVGTVAPDSGGDGPATPGEAAAPVRVDTVYHATVSGVSEPRQQIVRSAQEWVELWQQITSILAPAPEAPSVDFSEHQLVVVALGQRATGGYDVAVAEAVETEGQLRVVLNELAPGPTCMTTQALTQPVLVVAVPRTEGGVEITLRRITRDCS